MGAGDKINLRISKNYSTISTFVWKPCEARGNDMHTLISNRTRGSLQKYIYMKTIERFAAYCWFAPKSFTHLTWFCIELSFHAVSFMTALARSWRFPLRIPWRNVQPYLLEKRSTGQYRAGFVGNVSGLICSALICNPVTYPFQKVPRVGSRAKFLFLVLPDNSILLHWVFWLKR